MAGDLLDVETLRKSRNWGATADCRANLGSLTGQGGALGVWKSMSSEWNGTVTP